VVALVAGIAGKAIGDSNKINKENCVQIRVSCQALLISKIDNLNGKVDELTKAVNSKLYGF
ncbi:MAG: hypothetical protein IMZ53_16100, partial [Thermoplasmata archaeon]|nr:hypothetical protein [Thermoplasmata archaeon]